MTLKTAPRKDGSRLEDGKPAACEKERTVTLSTGVVLRIAHSARDAVFVEGLANHHHGGWTGSWIWEAADDLTKLLSAEPERVRGKRVIELGSGTGLVGLAAGALGARGVTLTDEVLFMAEHNLDVNFIDEPELHQRFTLQKLCWGDEQQLSASKPPYDVILGSDILFFDSELSRLADTIIGLSAPGTHILLAGPDCLPHQRARHYQAFYAQLREGGIELVDVLRDGPRAKKLKLLLDSDRGASNIIEMVMVEKLEESRKEEQAH